MCLAAAGGRDRGGGGRMDLYLSSLGPTYTRKGGGGIPVMKMEWEVEGVCFLLFSGVG